MALELESTSEKCGKYPFSKQSDLEIRYFSHSCWRRTPNKKSKSNSAEMKNSKFIYFVSFHLLV